MTAAGFTVRRDADDATQPTQRGHFERPEPTVITCDGPAGAVCECGDYDDWEYEVCEGCGLPAPEASR